MNARSRRHGLVLLMVLGIAMLASIAQARPLQEEDGPDPEEEARNKVAADQFFDFRRTFPRKVIPLGARIDAIRAKEKIARTLALAGVSPSLAFEPIGPKPLASGPAYGGPYPVSGRVSALAFARNGGIYLGAAQGGVWRSGDGGGHWTPITDATASLAVGSITVDPADPDTIYVGTGEQSFSCGSYYGAGILKSTDRGDTWSLLENSNFIGRTVGDIVVQHPAPGKTTLFATTGAGIYSKGCEIYANAPSRGVFRSTDGGAHWKRLKGGLPTTPDLSATALVVDPSDADTMFAAFRRGGIYRSTNGGATWKKLADNLPAENVARIELAIAPTDGDRIYVSIEDDTTGDVLGLYRSDDGGDHWTVLPRPAEGPPGYDIVCQCFYDNYIAVQPDNREIVYWGAIDLWKSLDGGGTWENITRSPGDAVGKMHVDQQAIAFSPANPERFIAGNDGGAYVTGDGGDNFLGVNNTLAITQFISITGFPNDPDRAFGGTQDNGTVLYKGDETWLTIDGGDGGATAINPDRPNVMYHTYFDRYLSRSTNGGGLWQLISKGLRGNRYLFYAPLDLDENNPKTIYFGSQYVNRSTNQGARWERISPDLSGGHAPLGIFRSVSAIKVSPADASVIWAGSSDGFVWVRRSGTWKNVTGLLPQRFVAGIALDPGDVDAAYVGYTGFEVLTPKRPGHVFHTPDRGKTWKNRTYNLPDIAINDLALDPATGTLYVATDIGVFELAKGGTTWVPSAGLPNVAVFSLSLNRDTGVILAATHGRGAFRATLPAVP